ncbi:hypothetical protein MPTK1_3g09600 [Marchantia polymorpha subsp. ruderalis]|uniref:Uncharacterized protein n=2 Tax=Marchantia polymorpha TaxID=3197 RepID=A0AAF6AZ36_MARPO|nr:hypothetical protein MARPO_0085s0067 [Marchantia polymorpha]BBN05020.1 hypothetical protein Mp_3g09600 [Marchantia polymorpha subsp. ruderalis]|eukprot:PTQ33855.1 hypothetical protein MARPO_0085s0067 [Marchantia polymorpha]
MASDQAILDKQRYFQSVHKLTHLKGPRDKITSVVIPWVLFGSAAFMMVRGIWNMSTGQGKLSGK